MSTSGQTSKMQPERSNLMDDEKEKVVDLLADGPPTIVVCLGEKEVDPYQVTPDVLNAFGADPPCCA